MKEGEGQSNAEFNVSVWYFHQNFWLYIPSNGKIYKEKCIKAIRLQPNPAFSCMAGLSFLWYPPSSRLPHTVWFIGKAAGPASLPVSQKESVSGNLGMSRWLKKHKDECRMKIVAVLVKRGSIIPDSWHDQGSLLKEPPFRQHFNSKWWGEKEGQTCNQRLFNDCNIIYSHRKMDHKWSSGKVKGPFVNSNETVLEVAVPLLNCVRRLQALQHSLR